MFNDLIVNSFQVRNFPTRQCAFERLQTPLTGGLFPEPLQSSFTLHFYQGKFKTRSFYSNDNAKRFTEGIFFFKR